MNDDHPAVKIGAARLQTNEIHAGSQAARLHDGPVFATGPIGVFQHSNLTSLKIEQCQTNSSG